MCLIRNVVLFFLLFFGNSVCCFAQESAGTVATISIPGGVWKDSLLDPSLFMDIVDTLVQKHRQEFQKLLREELLEQDERLAASNYLGAALSAGEVVCLDWRGEKCVVRVLSESEWKSWLEMSQSSLPRDAKSKEFYKVKSVKGDALTIEKDSTRLAIPLQSIIFIQRGTEPLAN